MSTVARSFNDFLCRMPRWGFPALCVALGLVLAGALWVGGEHDSWWAVLVMAAYGGFIYLLSPRSEVVALLGGDARDERQRSINEKASAATFAVLVGVFVAGFLVSAAMGSSVSIVFADLSAFSGLTWVTALVVLTRRG